MGRTIFVPLTDDLLYEYPERILGPVIPFSQQARRVAVESAGLCSATPNLDIKTKLGAPGANSAPASKRGKATLARGGALR